MEIENFIANSDREMAEKGYLPLGWGSYSPEKTRVLKGEVAGSGIMSDLGNHWDALYASRELEVAKRYQTPHDDTTGRPLGTNPMSRIYIPSGNASKVYLVPDGQSLEAGGAADKFMKDLSEKRLHLNFAAIDGRESLHEPSTEMALIARNQQALLQNIKIVSADTKVSQAIADLSDDASVQYDIRRIAGAQRDEAGARRIFSLAQSQES